MNRLPQQNNEGVEIIQHDFRVSEPVPATAKRFGPVEETHLRDLLKRCSAVTVSSACEFRKTGHPIHLSLVVVGIIERYVEPDLRMKLRPPNPNLRLVEDLGIDSLTMIEIVMMAEEALGITIDAEELRALHSIGDVVRFVENKSRLGHAG